MLIADYLAESKKTNVAFAAELGVPPSLLSQWATGVRKIPAERCLQVERATNGLVRCEDLRPDIDWSRPAAEASAAAASDAAPMKVAA